MAHFVLFLECTSVFVLAENRPQTTHGCSDQLGTDLTGNADSGLLYLYNFLTSVLAELSLPRSSPCWDRWGVICERSLCGLGKAYRIYYTLPPVMLLSGFGFTLVKPVEREDE